jgi:hypothetical protein
MKSMKGTCIGRLSVALRSPVRSGAGILVDPGAACAGEPASPSGPTSRWESRVTRRTQRSVDRPPVNVAIVLDRSGSMAGDKIRQAKEAAKYAVDLLGPQDILSIITYESTVDVLMPATQGSGQKQSKRLDRRNSDRREHRPIRRGEQGG